MLELSIFAIAVLWGFHMVKLHGKPKPAPAPRTPPRPVFKLNLEGVTTLSGSRALVARAGVSPRFVTDLGYLAGPTTLAELPKKVRSCLADCHQAGQARGPGVPGILFRNEPLVAGQALYFAVCGWPDGSQELVVFVDSAPARSANEVPAAVAAG